MEIRHAKLEDAESLLAIYAPYVQETAVTFESLMPSVQEFQKRIQKTQEKFPFLVAEADGKLVGYAYAHTYYDRDAYDWTAELTIYLDMKARQSGIGTALYDRLEAELAQQNIINFMACIALPNEPSVNFHKKRGFEQVGHFKKVGFKFGKWRDTVWMQKRIKEVAIPDPILYKQD